MGLASEMGLTENEIRTIGLSGLLHDWGMTRIPAEIRNASRVLSRAEFAEVQKHPLYTLELLERVDGLPEDVPMICYQAHEQPNGRGYPRGRRDKEIHPGARILHVADAYCALTSRRPFRLPLTPYAAVECLVRNTRDRSFDPDAVRALLHVLSLFPIGSYVMLSDDSMGRVIRRNGNHFAKPIVQIVRRSDGTRIDPALPPTIIDAAHDRRKIVRDLPTPGRQEVALRPDLQMLRRI
jgi:HD-GYP domain-containing protein (c-di-GMP phosphodiesterase class II)